MGLDEPLTIGLIVTAAVPSLVSFAKWAGGREFKRNEDANAGRDAKIAALEAKDSARVLREAERDRDMEDLGKKHDDTAKAVKELGETVKGDLKTLRVDLKNEMVRAMRDALSEKPRGRK